MEFTHGRREGFYIAEEEDQDEASKNPPFLPSSSSSTPSSSPSSSTAFIWNDGSSGSGGIPGGVDNSFLEKEHMFDKVVTPSDVGKLNRLVIPKQHAEKHFPLDASTNEKGLLLSFEDRTGKPWRFRYSYWNSSQSYVMTKGWSRFVKEKRLDAGDTVSFGRGVGETGRDRLFIDWKRRPENHDPARFLRPPPLQGVGVSFAQPSWTSRLLVPSPQPTTTMYGHNSHVYAYGNATSSIPGGGQILYFSRPAAPMLPPQIAVQQGFGGDGSSELPQILNAVPIIHNQNTASKRVRLFGVNLDCPESETDAYHGNIRSSGAGIRFQPRIALPLLQLPHSAGADSSGASSSSTSKEQPSSLDLDL